MRLSSTEEYNRLESIISVNHTGTVVPVFKLLSRSPDNSCQLCMCQLYFHICTL